MLLLPESSDGVQSWTLLSVTLSCDSQLFLVQLCFPGLLRSLWGQVHSHDLDSHTGNLLLLDLCALTVEPVSEASEAGDGEVGW